MTCFMIVLQKRLIPKTVTPPDDKFRPENIKQLETFLRNAINSGTLVQFVDSKNMPTNDGENSFKSLQNQSYAMCHLDSMEGSEVSFKIFFKCFDVLFSICF